MISKTTGKLSNQRVSIVMFLGFTTGDTVATTDPNCTLKNVNKANFLKSKSTTLALCEAVQM